MTPLHRLGETLRDAMLAIPLPIVRIVFVGILILLAIWVIRLPAEETTPPEGARKWDENLKPFAVLALLIQVAIYLIF